MAEENRIVIPRSSPELCAAAFLGFILASPSYAHHGVAGLGATVLEGPGAPVESASSAVLPEGSILVFTKLDHAKFKSINAADTQVNYNQFWMAGMGYGVKPWFSAYMFVPYNRKIDTAEPAGATTSKFDTSGWADISLMGQIGFKYDKGFQLVPANESADDLEDWHFTAYAGNSLPTGNPNMKNRDGNIDPGKSTGFGRPDWSIGLTATKMLSPKLTFNTEISTIRFLKYHYTSDTAHPGGFTAQFGSEHRANLGLAYRFYASPAQKLRLDISLETQFLRIARDMENGVGQEATGGKMVYLLPGIRVYKDNLSFAFGVKKAIWKSLNEDALQQGSEGKEKYRLIFSASGMF